MSMVSMNVSSDHVGPLRDVDIRRLLHKALVAEHADDPTACIMHELEIPRPSARADVVALNGELCAFEIKSEVDSLMRLPRQVRSFSAVFDRASVVIAERHLKGVMHMLPEWWGVIVVGRNGASLTSSQERAPALNPCPSIEALLHILYVPEIVAAARLLNTNIAWKRQKKEDLIRTVMIHVDETLLRGSINTTLKRRVGINVRRPDLD